MASPRPLSSALSARSVVPDRAVTRPLAVSAAVIPVQLDRSSATPEVAAAAVNECPLPSARSASPAAAASLTAAEISASLRGRLHRAGVAVAVPAQLRHTRRPADGCAEGWLLITGEYSYFTSAGLLCEHVCRPGPPPCRTGPEPHPGDRPRTLRPGHRRHRPAAGPRRPGRVRPERGRHDPPGRRPPGPGGDQVAALPLPDRARAGHRRLPRSDVLLAGRSPLAARYRDQR